MIKIRPVSANPVRSKPALISHVTPSHSFKRDLRILQSPETAARHFENAIFKLTEGSLTGRKDLESTEISRELKSLKSFANRTQVMTSRINTNIGRLEAEISQTKSKGLWGKKLGLMLIEIKDLQVKIELAKKQQDEKLEERQMYFHIEKRMVETKINLDIKARLLQEKLALKNQTLNAEQTKCLKNKESRCKSAKMCRNFDKTTYFYNATKNSINKKLTKEQEFINRIASARLKNESKKSEIVETVHHEEIDRKNKETREKLMLTRLWQNYLAKKIKINIEKYGKIEQAFNKIRLTTGLQDVDDVLEKFLTKENSLEELTKSLALHEAHKELFLKMSQSMQEKINKLTLRDSSLVASVSNDELLGSIRELALRNAQGKSKLAKLKTIKSRIVIWLRKNIKKVNSDLDPQVNNVRLLVEIMKSAVTDALKSLKQIKGKEIHNFNTQRVKVLAKNCKVENFTIMLWQENLKNDKLNYLELVQLEESSENQKRRLFMPILEKFLIRK